MTREEILAMEAGPQLDFHLISAKLIPHVSSATGEAMYWDDEWKQWRQIPPLSTTWEGMRLVMKALTSDGTAVEVLFSSDGCDVQIFSDKGYAKAEAKTAPHAVALAAMLAVGGGDA